MITMTRSPTRRAHNAARFSAHSTPGSAAIAWRAASAWSKQITRTPARDSLRAIPAPILPRPTMPISMFAPETGGAILGSDTVDGLSRSAAMACDGGDGGGSLARGVTLGAQARGRLLGIPGEQRAVVGMGFLRS